MRAFIVKILEEIKRVCNRFVSGDSLIALHGLGQACYWFKTRFQTGSPVVMEKQDLGCEF